MKKLFLTSFVLFLVTGCGGGGPSFEGKSLSQWMKDLRSSSGPQRRQAVQALGEIAKTNKETLPQILPVLIAQLKDQDVEGRRAAALALGKQGSEAKTAIPDLLKALGDADRDVRSNSTQALVEIDPDNASIVEPLARLLADKELEVRRSAVIALGNMGPVAKPAVPAIEEARKKEEKDFDFKRDVGAALQKINAKFPPR